MKKIVLIILSAVLLLSAVSCTDLLKPQEKVFSSNGMSITLTTEFNEASIEGYTVCYESKDVAVFILKEAFSLQAGLENQTVDYYAELVRNANMSKAPGEIKKYNGLTYLEYDHLNEEKGVTYRYFTTMFKGTDAFWLVQFACDKNEFADKRQDFINWANTVAFAN